jgi:hypothetical protein
VIRRPGDVYLCSDSSAWDLGEHCGRPQLVLVYDHWLTNQARNPDGYQNFGGKEVLEGLAALFGKYGKDMGFAVVVRSGSAKVVIENPASPGSYMPSGPAPTPQDCDDITSLYGLPEGIVRLYDKDRLLNNDGKQLVKAGFTPSLLVADAEGRIVATLPGADGKLTLVSVEAAIEAALGGG